MKNVRSPRTDVCSMTDFLLLCRVVSQPDCKAAFRRMWQIGPVFRVYDKLMFPTPEADKAKFEVVDEKTGKTVDIPHPVSSLRIWNPETQQYDDVSPILDGSPEDPASYWKGLEKELLEQWGEEEFADMTKAD